MAWQTPKTNWQAADAPLPDDFNRIEGNVQDLQNTKETPAGAQAKADAAETSAKSYADNIGTALSGIIGSLGSLLTTVKTNIVAAINSLKSELDAHKAETASINAIGHVYAAEFTATLSTSWSGSAAPYTQTVTINGITSAHNPIIDVVMSGTYSTDQQRIEQWGYIYRAVTGTNQITFYASEKPTVSLPIRVKVVR